MDKKMALSLRLELIWWIFTFVVLAGVLYPILTKISSYPFLLTNSLFVIIFITFTRYVFLLKHTFMAHKETIKVVIVLIIIPIIFYLVSEVNYFQTFLDERGIDSFMQELPYEKQHGLANYIRSEMLLFGVGSVIITIILPFRLILSVWRNRNKGTV